MPPKRKPETRITAESLRRRPPETSNTTGVMRHKCSLCIVAEAMNRTPGHKSDERKEIIIETLNKPENYHDGKGTDEMNISDSRADNKILNASDGEIVRLTPEEAEHVKAGYYFARTYRPIFGKGIWKRLSKIYGHAGDSNGTALKFE